MAALMILACPNCLSTAADGVLTHDGMCPQPEVREYLASAAAHARPGCHRRQGTLEDTAGMREG